jgi:hypothetical protein
MVALCIAAFLSAADSNGTEGATVPILTVCQALKDSGRYAGRAVIIVGRWVSTSEGSWLDEKCGLVLVIESRTYPTAISTSYVVSDVAPPPRSPTIQVGQALAVTGPGSSEEDEVVTDSEYVKNGITTWIHNWKRKGWLTAAKKPVVNQDLWQDLDDEADRHKTTWSWTKGHASHADNNRCDELATQAARDQSHGCTED